MTLTSAALQIHATAREAFASGRTQSIEFRKAQIAQVGYLLKDNEDRFKDALKSDLGRPYQETELYVASYQPTRLDSTTSRSHAITAGSTSARCSPKSTWGTTTSTSGSSRSGPRSASTGRR